MRTLQELLHEVRSVAVVGPVVLESELSRLDFDLPADLIAFYRELGDGASFEFGDFRISTIADLRRPSFLPDLVGLSWIDICDAGDGNCVAIDTATVSGDACRVIDVFHETAGIPGEHTIIARSFTEFLDRILADRCQYWLDSDFPGYGDGLGGT